MMLEQYKHVMAYEHDDTTCNRLNYHGATYSMLGLPRNHRM
jgi:hypothetical protein